MPEIIKKQFYKSFDTTFMGNTKSCKKKNYFIIFP